MKRICLFAAYNYKKNISQYVVDYLKELSQYADIYYMSDSDVEKSELDKIKPYVKKSYILKHGKYDFGSYSELAKNYVGWDKINQYEELLLVNDSCFCVNPFYTVFEKMGSQKSIDFWGLLGTDDQNLTSIFSFQEYLNKDILEKKFFCIGSYFLGVRKNFFQRDEFKDFLDTISLKENRHDVCTSYEGGIFQLAYKLKLNIVVYDENVYRYSTMYMRQAFNLIKNGFPLLKVRIFIDNIGGETLMDDLAEISSRDCKVDFIKYVSQVRSERGVRIKEKSKKIDIRNRIRFLKYYLMPPLINYVFFYIKRVKNFIKKNRFKVIMKHSLRFVLPVFMHPVLDISKRLKEYMLSNTKGVKFSLSPRPFKGHYKSQIHNYEKTQKSLVALYQNQDEVVIFFNVMREIISGGMLSIDRFVENSKKHIDNDICVLQAGLPLLNACIENPFFTYASEIIDFSFFVKNSDCKKLLLNIPECFVPIFLQELTKEQYLWLYARDFLQINILNQSDELMPSQNDIEVLRVLCNNNLTITAAHERYCTQEKQNQYKAPLHLLTPFLPEFYFTPVDKKEKIIVLSPDHHLMKDKIVNRLKKEFNDFKIITVNNMTLEEYKKLISKAMFVISFGEGYDGYFLEPYLSGTIGITTYNKIFFPESFDRKKTVYYTWDDLYQNITEDMRSYMGDCYLYQEIVSDMKIQIQKYTNNDRSNGDLKKLYDRFVASK